MQELLCFLVEKFNNFRKKVIDHKVYQKYYIDAPFVERAKLEVFATMDITPQIALNAIKKMLEMTLIEATVHLQESGEHTVTFAVNEDVWKQFSEKFEVTKEDKDLLNRYIVLFMQIYEEVVKEIQKNNPPPSPPPPLEETEAQSTSDTTEQTLLD